jgi:L-ornithine N5-oxygenase
MLARFGDRHLNPSRTSTRAAVTESNECRSAGNRADMIAVLLAGLRDLLAAADRLRRQSYLGAREHVAVPARYVAQFQSEILTLERRFRAVEMDAVGIAALASDQVTDLTASVVLLENQRYHVQNWTAQVGIIWLRFRALAMLLGPILPDVGQRLFSALTGQSPAWPLLEGMQGVRLATLPSDLTDCRISVHSSPVSAVDTRDQQRESRSMSQSTFDILGIGFGPANIAFAAALEERHAQHSVLFLERLDAPAWQPAMLLNGSDIQNNPLRDLVTPRNPRSRYSFTNFLHEHGRLFEYLNLGIEFPLRKEYAQYVTWVARQFDRCVRYGTEVTNLRIEVQDGQAVYVLTTSREEVLNARSIVAAPGRTPFVPDLFAGREGERLFHLTRYLPAVEHYQSRYGVPKTVCVVGGSQSAVELILDLSARFPDAFIINVQRGFGFSLKDTSPFSDRVYFPEHVDYYFNASRRSKAAIDEQLKRTNYSSADGDVIRKLYLTLYEQKLDRAERIEVRTNTRIISVDASPSGLVLGVEEIHRRERSQFAADIVILATGFRNLGPGAADERIPPVLASLANDLRTDESGVVEVARDYRLKPKRRDHPIPPTYLNGLCETTHGMGDAGSFSLLSLRSELIARSLESALESKPSLLEAS